MPAINTEFWVNSKPNRNVLTTINIWDPLESNNISHRKTKITFENHWKIFHQLCHLLTQGHQILQWVVRRCKTCFKSLFEEINQLIFSTIHQTWLFRGRDLSRSRSSRLEGAKGTTGMYVSWPAIFKRLHKIKST